MPRKQLVIVEGYVLGGGGGGDPDAHPEHPIYIPITPPPDSGLHPEHPIYIPVFPTDPGYGVPEGGHPDHTLPGDLPRPDQGLPGPQPHPEHPIYIPLPPDSLPNLPHVEQPIYWPVEIWGPNDPRPDVPINLPDGVLDEEQKQKLKEFLVGNLPPFTPPDYAQPVKR